MAGRVLLALQTVLHVRPSSRTEPLCARHYPAGVGTCDRYERTRSPLSATVDVVRFAERRPDELNGNTCRTVRWSGPMGVGVPMDRRFVVAVKQWQGTKPHVVSASVSTTQVETTFRTALDPEINGRGDPGTQKGPLLSRHELFRTCGSWFRFDRLLGLDGIGCWIVRSAGAYSVHFPRPLSLPCPSLSGNS